MKQDTNEVKIEFNYYSLIITSKMGWGTTYVIELAKPITNFDCDIIEEWFTKKYNKYISLNYMRYQYKDPYIIDIHIKYGRDEIIDILDKIYKQTNISMTIINIETNENEFKDYKNYIDMYIIPL